MLALAVVPVTLPDVLSALFLDPGDHTALDSEGMTWTLTEAALTADDGRVMHRVPAHRAFWFGWVAAFPTTRLVM